MNLQTIAAIAVIIFVLNLPFGYWRASTKKFSLQWILAIHIPVPFVIVLRIFSGIGWKFNTIPILVTAFLSGQFIGGKIRFWRKKSAVNSVD